jgi:hypothetical protein
MPSARSLRLDFDVLVFWLAHVHAQALTRPRERLPAVMGHELAMIEAPAPSVVLLLLPAVVELVAWGVPGQEHDDLERARLRRPDHPWPHRW